MPGYSRFTSSGRWTPRIPSTYDGFVSIQNLTWPERVICVHTVGPARSGRYGHERGRDNEI